MRFKKAYKNKAEVTKKLKRMIGQKGMPKKTQNKTEKCETKKKKEIKNKTKRKKYYSLNNSSNSLDFKQLSISCVIFFKKFIFSFK